MLAHSSGCFFDISITCFCYHEVNSIFCDWYLLSERWKLFVLVLLHCGHMIWFSIVHSSLVRLRIVLSVSAAFWPNYVCNAPYPLKYISSNLIVQQTLPGHIHQPGSTCLRHLGELWPTILRLLSAGSSERLRWVGMRCGAKPPDEIFLFINR